MTPFRVLWTRPILERHVHLFRAVLLTFECTHKKEKFKWFTFTAPSPFFFLLCVAFGWRKAGEALDVVQKLAGEAQDGGWRCPRA